LSDAAPTRDLSPVRTAGTGRVRESREQWAVFPARVLSAHISIEQYERNMRRLDANRSRAQSLGAVCDGPAMLGAISTGLGGKQ
jgi:hypothetical protein